MYNTSRHHLAAWSPQFFGHKPIHCHAFSAYTAPHELQQGGLIEHRYKCRQRTWRKAASKKQRGQQRGQLSSALSTSADHSTRHPPPSPEQDVELMNYVFLHATPKRPIGALAEMVLPLAYPQGLSHILLLHLDFLGHPIPRAGKQLSLSKIWNQYAYSSAAYMPHSIVTSLCFFIVPCERCGCQM